MHSCLKCYHQLTQKRSLPLRVGLSITLVTSLGLVMLELTLSLSGGIFTGRKQSLGKGNIFTGMCQSFCPQGSFQRAYHPGGGGVRESKGAMKEPPTLFNKRAIRILLECIIVHFYIFECKGHNKVIRR